MSERDKFLTVAMGDCWHEDNNAVFAAYTRCVKCKTILTGNDDGSRYIIKVNPDFSVWQGFGKLWEWAQDQEWLSELLYKIKPEYTDVYNAKTMINKVFINPDRFASAVYEFLINRGGERCEKK